MRRPLKLAMSCVCAVMLAACADAGPVSGASAAYVVQPHDTLYSIAWRHNLDYRDLARWNGIGPDFHIAVGQVLRLQPGAGSAVAAATKSVPPNPAPSNSSTTRNASPAPSNAARAVHGWVWPTQHDSPPRARGNGGLLIGGRVGQPVRSAAAGRVVYTGSGIRGYGILIIIKHSESLLSAYAYNQEVLVREGQDVTAGQPIAAMGQGSNRTPELYFEIRLNGKPVNPLPYLSGKM